MRTLGAAIERAVAENGSAVEVPTTRVSPLAARVLATVQKRTGQRRGEILDVLLREHGADLMERLAGGSPTTTEEDAQASA